jgi:hypothetical protein
MTSSEKKLHSRTVLIQDPHGSWLQRWAIDDACSCPAVCSDGRECVADSEQLFETVVIQWLSILIISLRWKWVPTIVIIISQAAESNIIMSLP